jgi:uncharacterized membrane protein HdeD (DUF308 family)
MKHAKEIMVIAMIFGVFLLLTVIIAGDYYIALREHRPPDESVITLLKMTLTGVIGVIAGYLGR